MSTETPARPSGRPPLWPAPWLALADACGGSSILRIHLGLKSKTSLSGRIAGTIPWTRDDLLSLAGLCRVHGVKLQDLMEPEIVCSVLVLGLGSYPAPGVRR